jgi:flagellar L-ring protein precursor FlgH
MNVHPSVVRVPSLVALLALALSLALPCRAPLSAQDTTAAGAAAVPAATPAPRRSWTSDRVPLAVGDVVTLIIDERTLASAGLRDADAEQRGRTMDVNLATPGGGGTAAGVRSSNDADSRRSGETVRQNTFRSELSTRVVAVSPTGMIQLKGTKRVQLDKSVQLVTITGWVRARDISPSTNTIESYRLADAEIAYSQEGSLGKPRGGIITRMLGKVWP